MALDGVSLRVETGKIFGIVGRSGAGKSTLIRCVNLLERPDEGQVRVLGQDLLALEEAGLRQARHRHGVQRFNWQGLCPCTPPGPGPGPGPRSESGPVG
ncbi:ATP-binding cassette domain-containing protein [Siccirubricoccus soli]|uniref:ATP-binding cassette domain-containing protein n=1 Tax=Siccirubricoccus soli TaxID=2899147 RepID=UPI0035155C02